MSKYLLLYRTDANAPAPELTPEQQQASMDSWMGWMGRAGESIVDFGSPVAGGDGTVGGYSIIDAADDAAVQSLLEGHPHEGPIDVLPFLAIPGM